MSRTTSPYLSGPDILEHQTCTVKEVRLDFSDAVDGCIKAGSPISATGKVANDATAIGVLQHDTYSDCGCGHGLVIVAGRIDAAVAEAHSGIAISAQARAGMPAVVFVGSDGCAIGGGASSGDVFTVTVTAKSDDGTNFSYSKDKSDAEIWEAYSNGKFVVCRLMVDVTFQGIHGNFFGGTFILDNISNDEDEGLYAVFMHHGHYVTYNGTTCIKMESLQFADSGINYGKDAVDFKSPSNQTPFSFLDS